MKSFFAHILSTSTLDQSAFAPEQWKQIAPNAANIGKSISGLGALQSLELVERKPSGESRFYRYRMHFRDMVAMFTVTLTKEDKITDFGLHPD